MNLCFYFFKYRDRASTYILAWHCLRNPERDPVTARKMFEFITREYPKLAGAWCGLGLCKFFQKKFGFCVLIHFLIFTKRFCTDKCIFLSYLIIDLFHVVLCISFSVFTPFFKKYLRSNVCRRKRFSSRKFRKSM